jgi:hypothetical protein
MGSYTNPSGGFETNPARSARPLVDLVPGPEGKVVNPTTHEALGASTALRNLLGVQNAGAWHWKTPDTTVRAANAIAVPGGGMTAAEMEALHGKVSPYGLGISDPGFGSDVTAGFGPSGKALSAIKTSLERQGVPGQLMRTEGDYIPLMEVSKPGEGQATQEMLSRISKLHPSVQERLSQSPAIADVAKGLAARDAELASEHGLQQRYDVQNLRELMSNPGWNQRLKDALKAGIPLPALAGVTVGGLVNQDNEPQGFAAGGVGGDYARDTRMDNAHAHPQAAGSADRNQDMYAHPHYADTEVQGRPERHVPFMTDRDEKLDPGYAPNHTPGMTPLWGHLFNAATSVAPARMGSTLPFAAPGAVQQLAYPAYAEGGSPPGHAGLPEKAPDGVHELMRWWPAIAAIMASAGRGGSHRG